MSDHAVTITRHLPVKLDSYREAGASLSGLNACEEKEILCLSWVADAMEGPCAGVRDV